MERNNERIDMGPLARVAVIIAATGLATTLVLPGRQTANIASKAFSGISQWTKVAQGRGEMPCGLGQKIG